MSGKHFVQVPICPQVLEYARDLMKHDLTALSPGAKKAGVLQDDEFVLYEAAFTSGVRLTVKLVSNKEQYQVIPEFHFLASPPIRCPLWPVSRVGMRAAAMPTV